MHHTLEQLYRQHHKPTLTRLQRCGFAAERTEDAMAEAWIILGRKLDQDPDYLHEDTAGAWLFTVARRELYRTIQADKRRCTLDTDACTAHYATSYTTEDEALANIELDHLVDAIRHQRAGRAAPIMARLLGLSYHETMAATGRTYTAVNRGVTEGRAELRELLA